MADKSQQVGGRRPTSCRCHKQNYPQDLWHFQAFIGIMSTEEAEEYLKQNDRDGEFVLFLTIRGTLKLSQYERGLRCSVIHLTVECHNRRVSINGSDAFDRITDLINASRDSLPKPLKMPATLVNWQIPRGELELEDKELARGTFAIVKLGRWRNMKVTVKQMQKNVTNKEAFIKEAEILARLHHPNIVQFLGVCEEPFMIVTKFVAHGSLLRYLIDHGRKPEVRSCDRVHICQEVCAGMEYLESCKCVHGDLAARNCLIEEKFHVKIADFGFARLTEDNKYSTLRGQFSEPWSPPEVLRGGNDLYRQFSNKSDVWAFGVTMWEVFSNGTMPYDDNKELKNRSTKSLYDYLTNGKMLKRPSGCSAEIYQVMLECWKLCPEERPAFCDLIPKLANL